MRIANLGTLPNIAPTAPTKPSAPASSVPGLEQPAGPSFGDTLKDAVGSVNELQGNADNMAQKLATGDVQDIHQVMLALNKASNAFGLTMQVRNKAVEAYQDIMRMQV